MSQKLQIEAHMCMPTFRKDRCGTMKFTSARELTKEEREVLLEAGVNDEMGWVVWSPNKVQIEDLPDEQATDNTKSPAKRLRAVIFLAWKQTGSVGNFESYYFEKMNKFIEHVKTKLD